MHLVRLDPSTGAFGLLLMAISAFASGCTHDCRSCNDICPGAIPRPAGTYACQWISEERARADQDNFVIYQYEWAADGVKLSPFGQQHVARIAQRINETASPVVIEPAADDKVNGLRRSEILSALANRRVQVPPDRVILGGSEAEGLYGEEAPGIARSMLSSRRGGQNVGAGFEGNQSGTFGPAQGSSLGTGAPMTTPTPGVGVGIY